MVAHRVSIPYTNKFGYIQVSAPRLFVLVFLVCIAQRSNGQGYQTAPDSPCPDLFRYQYDGTEWHGEMEIPFASASQTIKLNVLLSLKAQLTTTYVGLLELFSTRESALREIQQKRNIRYRIRFPIQSPLPSLKQITVNGRIICTGPGEFGGYITEIRLEHTFYTDLPPSAFVNGGSNTGGTQSQPSDSFDSFGGTDDTYNFRPQAAPPRTTEAPLPPIYQPFKPDNSYQPDPSFQPAQSFQPNPERRPETWPQRPIQQSPPVSRPTQQSPSSIATRPTQHSPPVSRPTQHSPPISRPTQTFVQPQAQPSNPAILPFDTSQPEPEPPVTNTLEQQPLIDNVDCGRPATRFGITPLIVGGQKIPRGSWPWLAAVYINKATGLSFNCGGNLVSTKVVVTAAHCFRTPEREYYATDVIVYLGRYNIMKWSEKGSHVTEVEQIYVHEDYMKEDQSFDADVAIVIMSERVKYSDYIRPICLWEGSDNLNDIVGSSGTVVGWGRDGSGNVVTPEPKKISVPIVSDAVCLRSSDTYRYITSKRTFCAGRRNGFGPCNGDSGSGMAIHKNNRTYLRGIVSAALADPVMNTCNLKEYVVFTDTAKFNSWIKSFMQL